MSKEATIVGRNLVVGMINPLEPGGGSRDFRKPIRESSVVIALGGLLTACAPATQAYMYENGIDTNTIQIFPIENEKIEAKNPGDSAEHIDFIYAEKPNGDPYLLFEEKKGEDEVVVYGYPIHLVFIAKDKNPDNIERILIVAPKTTDPKSDSWKTEQDDWQILMDAILQKPVSKTSLDLWSDDPENEQIKFTRFAFWDPVQKKGIIDDNPSAPGSRGKTMAMALVSPSVARPEEASPILPTITPIISIPTLPETPIPAAPTPEATATPNAEATKQAEFETRKAEALKMVSIKLDSPEDFASLPVLDDVADFDSGKVQEAEYWLIDNVLPPADIKLPESWRTACNDATSFCTMSYDMISEANVNVYRGVTAFFVMRDGVQMLRLGVEYGGSGQLIHFNFEDPKWWTDPVRIKTLIAAFNRTDIQMLPISQYGTDYTNWLVLENGYLIGDDFSNAESYSRKVTLERSAGGNQFTQYWVDNRLLPAGADTTVFGAFFFPL